MKLPIITTLIIALSFLVFTLAEAKVYKWKDAEGVVHYSSTPPKPSEKISDLKEDLHITDNKALAHKSQRETKASAKEENNKKSHSQKTKKRNYCNGLRRNLVLLKRNLKVKWVQNGKSTELNAEQRQDKLRSLEESIDNECSFGEDGQEREEEERRR